MLEPAMFDRELSLMDHEGVLTRKVSVRFGNPYVVKEYGDEGTDWAVDIQISGLVEADSYINQRSMQVDPLGAFISALRLASECIRLSEPYKAGRLFWLEPKDNCGFPEFTGPAYRPPAAT